MDAINQNNSLFNAQQKFIILCKPIHMNLQSYKRVLKAVCFQLQDKFTIFRKPKKPTLQNQTLLIALYMFTFRVFFKGGMKNVTQDFANLILKHGDELIFHALYNLKYDDTIFESDYNLIKETTKTYPVMIYSLKECDVFMALYGINMEHWQFLKNLDNPGPFGDLVTFDRLIDGIIESYPEKVFTKERQQNLQKIKPHTIIFNNQEYYKIMVNQLSESVFLNIPTPSNNIHVNITDNYSLSKIKTEYNNIIDIYSSVTEYLKNNNKIHLYGVIMSYDFNDVDNFTDLILLDNVFESIQIASKFEYGMVICIPHDSLVVNEGVYVDEDIFMSRKHYPVYTKTNYMQFKSPINITYTILLKNSVERKILHKSNIQCIIMPDRADISNKFN